MAFLTSWLNSSSVVIILKKALKYEGWGDASADLSARVILNILTWEIVHTKILANLDNEPINL